jgi:4-amino-4-deoxy-L-arabinose transferase-like glycosyltransferase
MLESRFFVAPCMTGPEVAASVRRLSAPFLLCLLVTASSALLLTNLGDPYITLWDEAVHVNVIRNLENNCCTPQLHRQGSGADPRDWTDSHVWLHKPPMPFYAHAEVARLAGRGVWGTRLAAVLLAEALVLLVFLIGVKFFGTWIGLSAATLVAFNHYTFQLVQGRQFGGVPDLALACVLMLALSRILAIANSPEWRQYVAFGALTGLAFLCKDGLALIPFVVLALAPGAWSWRRHAAGCALALLCAVLVLLPPTLYIARLFPLEALFEQQHRVAHLVRNIEGWGRPFDYYFTVYLARVTSPLMLGSIFAATVLGLLEARRHPRLAILSLWVAAYLLVLTPAVSKISNFIYPVLPAASLLVCATAGMLWRERRYDLVLAASVPVLVTAVLLQWNIVDSSEWFVDFPDASQRATLVLFEIGTFVLALGLLKRVTVPKPALTSFVVAGMAMGLILTASIHASLAATTRRPRDYNEQAALRQASLAVARVLQPDDVVLVDWPAVRKSHLYVMYWSGLESFEITGDKPVATRLREMPAARRVFLLRNSCVPDRPEILRIEHAALCRLR